MNSEGPGQAAGEPNFKANDIFLLHVASNISLFLGFANVENWTHYPHHLSQISVESSPKMS
jgi:hypothetical protein